MKWPIIILMMVMFATVTFADKGAIETYKPNEIFDLSIHLSNMTGDVVGATCNIQIMNVSYDVKDETTLNEIGGGWYNYTYNTSKTGKYFCRQNCTLGAAFTSGTCDFIIEGSETMSIAISIILIGVSLLFFILSFSLDDKEHIALKTLFLFLGLITLLISLNYAYVSAVDNGASNAVQSILSIVYRVGLYGFVLFSGYTVIYYIYRLFIHFKELSKG